MIKTVQLKLSQLKYGGDPIGNKIHLEVSCLNSFVHLNKNIKPGAEITLDNEVGRFTTDKDILTLPLNLKIVEQDAIFNDVGTKDVTLKINLSGKILQIYTYTVEVKEKRGLPLGSRTAIFSLTLETKIFPSVMYVGTLEESGGWLTTRDVTYLEDTWLPAYLKIRLDKVENKREYVTVLEGPLQGIQVSVKLDVDGKSYFNEENPHTKSIALTYSISKKIITCNGKTYKAVDDPSTPWKKTTFDLEIADHLHEGGLTYRAEATYARTWFRIGHTGERYLHTGRISAGCITLTEQNKWDELYNILVRARKGDGKSIGTLKIID